MFSVFLQNWKRVWYIILFSFTCDNNRITDLNYKFREKKFPTDILSWPEFDLKNAKPGLYPKSPPISENAEALIDLGNIAIAYEACFNELENTNINHYDHLMHLLLHGCLHLLGFIVGIYARLNMGNWRPNNHKTRLAPFTSTDCTLGCFLYACTLV